MKRSSQKLKSIGIVDQQSTGWTAGASYTRTMLNSLVQACADQDIKVSLITDRKASYELKQGQVNKVEVPEFTYLPLEKLMRKWLGLPPKDKAFVGEGWLRKRLRIVDTSNPIYAAKQCGISVVVPVKNVSLSIKGVKAIGWLPDFQHTQLPEMFSKNDVQSRDGAFRRVLSHADIVLVSSNDAYEHCKAFAPNYIDKVRVLPFPSIFAFEPPMVGNHQETLSRYHLPQKFALIANQIWQHKNHIVAIEALGILKKRGYSIPLVITGLPSDHRDRLNTTLSALLQAIAYHDLHGQIMILGQVPFADLVNLLRVAAIVIQPSRFEGWNTSVQDAKALGRPLLCSDIPVHREQAPTSLGFFGCEDPTQLAELLLLHWDSLQPGVDPKAEEAALLREKEFALHHGNKLLAICQEANEQII